MTGAPAEIRFEKARKRLSLLLKNLEEVVKEKLHETAINAKMIDIAGNTGDGQQAILIEQQAIIQNLNAEINSLQKNLADLGRETEFLHERNKALAQKISYLRNEGKSLFEAIESDLVRVEEIIKNHDN